MSDITVRVGAVDNATPTLKKVRGEADKLGQSLRRAAEASGRIGGSVGGIGGRVLGSLAMGGGFAAAGLAGIGLMGVVNAIKSASDRAAEAAQSNVMIAQQMTAITRNAQQAMQAVMAGGVSQASLLQRARARGIREPSKQFQGLGSFEEQMQATLDAADLGLDPLRMAEAASLARTGQVGLTAAVSGIGRGMTRQRIIEESLPLGTPNRSALARQILSGTRAAVERPGGSAIESAVQGSTRVQAEQAAAMFSGAAAEAVNANAEEQLNPEARMRADMQRQIRETAQQMQAAADAQWGLVKVFEAFRSGITFGGWQSRQEVVNDWVRNRLSAWEGAP